MLCPSCGFDNIEGMDRCENCMKSLRDLDVPRAEATEGLVRSVMENDLRWLGREETLTARPEETALDVIQRMKESGSGCALVLDGQGKLAGIFTEHDVLRHLGGADATGAMRRPVSELMTPNPETLRETDTVAAALSKMSIGRYRHVPVVRGDGTCTVTSVQHLLKYIAQEEW